ncbi:hypothetical protein CC78DRAFT_574147 [Lojkania enalia]|uniref:Uncharacterized protein n=1 Tax=Lojkania enalia TaxID=147567 RepID=A0A9P4NB79_9PLEO|nr:hypothetical protein CC78DRAFT_574147 [Didymosphaeria enalia]
MQSLTVLQFSSTGWTQDAKRVDQLFGEPDPPSLRYILIEEDIFSSCNQVAPELSQYFQIPDYMLSDVYQHSNGFLSFGESFDKDSHMQSHNTRFRLLIKIVNEHMGSSYTWHEMTFFSHWKPGQCAMLCIGASSLFQYLLRDSLSRMWTETPPSEPYSLHVPLIEAIISMQNSSVWAVRNIVRSIEKDRSRSTRGFHDFISLHEASRHAIHSFETLSVSIEMLGAMQQQILDLSNKLKDGGLNDASCQIRIHIESQIRMLRNLLLRSQSNKERLQNEIALGYNMIAQRDSQVMRDLGEAARLDSSAVRTIALVTMAFLPPTFISAIFSMSFFNYTPAQDAEARGWSVSNKFWIYWAFAIPLTCLTMAIWVWRQKLIVN